MIKVLIIGKNGQVANELVAEKPNNVEVLALGKQEIDITSAQALQQVVECFKPTVVINASAYTAVDKAESECNVAYEINEKAVALMAEVSKNNKLRFIHISTDFIFDGQSNTAYTIDSSANPKSVYGASKLAGELAIKNIASKNAVIVRTSWVYSSFGNNFVKTMLKLMAERESLGVVVDQIGCPTYAKGLARFLWRLAFIDKVEPIYHWSDAGVASWYDFAMAIQEIAYNQGRLNKKIPIKPILSSAYPTPAERPKFSLLNTTESYDVKQPRYWREQLADCLQNLT